VGTHGASVDPDPLANLGLQLNHLPFAPSLGHSTHAAQEE
jgi:hypothetical protein